VAVAAVLIGGAVVLAATEPDLFGGGGQQGQPPAAGEAVPIDRQAVRVAASSTIDDPRFQVANLTDGDTQTAWQSDGRAVRDNAGVRLTFRFASQVRLARIVLINGYGRSPEDYQNNERLARARVSGGDWSAEWKLTDTVSPQALDVASDAGAVTEVTIEVAGVYPGARFPDLAVSEVTFYERR
jgi:hypothetical protein